MHAIYPKSAVLSNSNLHMGASYNFTKQTFPRFVWTGGGSRKPAHWIISCLVLLLCSTLTLSQSDTCSIDTDCHPPAEDLVGDIPNFPDYRSVEVSSTCGSNGSTPYFMAPSVLVFDVFYCNESNPHPAEYILDRSAEVFDTIDLNNPIVETYWQSENSIEEEGDTPTEEMVCFNMTTPFLIRKFRAIFAAPEFADELNLAETVDMRPEAMVIEIKPTVDAEWIPLRYYAEDCSRSFPGVPQQTTTALPATTAACIEEYYNGDTTTLTEWPDGLQEVRKNSLSALFSVEIHDYWYCATKRPVASVR